MHHAWMQGCILSLLFKHQPPQMPASHQSSFAYEFAASTAHPRTSLRSRHQPISTENGSHTQTAATPRPRPLSPTSPSPSVHAKHPSPTTILPGKRGKATRLLLVSFILFPPVAIFFLAMFPVILLISVVFTYSVAWLLYYTMAGPITFSALPLDPRRVWKLNNVVFSVIISNLRLIPIGLSLIRYRYLTMRGLSGLVVDVVYNPKRPHVKLDLYIPDNTAADPQQPLDVKALKPVIVFIYGGAWSSGSKWLYTLVGARLRSMGYIVVMPDYAIYPQGYIADMEQDVKIAVQWTSNHCQEFGGDPQRIYLMGHSAGAHLCALTVLNDGIQRIPVSLFGSSSSTISSSPILSTLLGESLKEGPDDVLPRIRGMILCSGVYEIAEHFKYESSRGVEEISAMARVMGNSQASFRAHSPSNVLQELLQVSTRIDKNYPTESQTRHQHLLRHFKSILPIETLVIHGDKDMTVPVRSSLEFFMELKTLQLGSGARMRVIKGMAHESPVVDLMPSFGREAKFQVQLMEELSQFIEGGEKTYVRHRN